MALTLGTRRAPVTWGLPQIPLPRPAPVPQPRATSRWRTVLPVVLVGEFAVGLSVALLR